MSTSARLLAYCSALILIACVSVASAATPSQVMVTFLDRSLLRTEFGQPGQTYTSDSGYTTSAWSRRVSDALAQDHHLVKDVDWPIRELGVHCVVYTVTDTRSLQQVLAALTADARVAAAQPLNTFRVLSGDPYLPLQTNLSTLSVLPAHRFAQGRGIKVAVVDTGVDTEHPDLRGQIEKSLDLVHVGEQRPAAEIHGTAVAGIIAASAANGQGIVGVAPAARVIALKACWPLHQDAAAAECNSLTLARALTQVLRLKPHILNLSLSGPPDPLLSALLKLVLAQGTVVVAAQPETAAPGFPNDVAHVVRVNSSQITALVGQESFSAPGNKVLTTFPAGAYSFVNGNSFAAAHVSGVVALLMELKPALSIDDVHRILRESVRPGSRRLHADTGLISACAALARVAPSVTCEPLAIPADEVEHAAALAEPPLDHKLL